MTAKRSILLLLGIFVATSTVYLIAVSKKRPEYKAPALTAAAPAAGPSRIVAYYFHVTVRCTTCKTIEAYSRETILNHFRNDIDQGRLEWKVVNVQLPENQHFIQDYQLFTKSVVLVHIADGKQRRHKACHVKAGSIERKSYVQNSDFRNRMFQM
jgi:hypothetical protein